MRISLIVGKLLLFSIAFFSYQFKGQSLFNSIEKQYADFKESAPKEHFFMITDKDIYHPGDVIWLNTTAFNIHQAAVSTFSDEVVISLRDRSSKELMQKSYALNGGVSHGAFQVPGGIDEGVYYLKANSAHNDANDFNCKKIVIQNNIAPTFQIKARFPEGRFNVGDQLSMTLEFKDFYNEAKKNVEYEIDLFDGNMKVKSIAGKVKKSGTVTLDIMVPERVETGIFNYTIRARSKGKEARLRGIIPTKTELVYLEFYPEYGKLVNGLASKVHIYTYDATGKPISIGASLRENDKVINSVSTNASGMGEFIFTPDIDNQYEVSINKPAGLERSYKLPAISPKGIAIKVIEKSASKAVVSLENGYISSRLVYIIAVSNGKFIWNSEHEIDRSEQVILDLTKAEGSFVHLVALNAAERIEGERIMVLPSKHDDYIQKISNVGSSSPGTESQIAIDMVNTADARIIFSAVNAPWISSGLQNPSIENVGLPSDILGQQVFMSSGNGELAISKWSSEKLESYYVPSVFSWDKILKTQGAFVPNCRRAHVIDNMNLIDQVEGLYAARVHDGIMHHSNLISEDYFTISNPDFIEGLNKEKVVNKPSYKMMLENNTPVLDVLMAIKPYTLDGSKIIFYGSANSINAQSGALIAIDGINRGTDASLLSNLSPYDVETITASTRSGDIQKYSGLNNVGVVEVTLKRGGELLESDEYTGPNFLDPAYTPERVTRDEDFRSTLHWQERRVLTTTDVQVFKYYNSQLHSKVNVKIVVIPTLGVPETSTFTYMAK